MRIISWLALASLFVPAAAYAQADDILAVQKAAFRTAADVKAFHTTGNIAVVCFSIGQERPPQKGIQVPLVSYVDPSPALLRAVTTPVLPVVKGSGCWADIARMGAITDTSTKARRTAMAIIMSTPEKVKDGLYKFLIERAFDLQTARGFRCTAIKRNNAWVVEKCVDGWVVG